MPTTMSKRTLLPIARTAVSLLIVLAACLFPRAEAAAPQPATKFEISFPASARAAPITGRVFLIVARNDDQEPRFRAGWWGDTPPIFGVDVSALRPGQAATV